MLKLCIIIGNGYYFLGNISVKALFVHDWPTVRSGVGRRQAHGARWGTLGFGHYLVLIAGSQWVTAPASALCSGGEVLHLQVRGWRMDQPPGPILHFSAPYTSLHLLSPQPNATGPITGHTKPRTFPEHRARGGLSRWKKMEGNYGPSSYPG